MSLALALALKRRQPAAGKKKKKSRKKQKEDEEVKEVVEEVKKKPEEVCIWSASQEAARRYLMATRRSCFISGGAGTGKSKLLAWVTQYWEAHDGLRFTSTASIGTAAYSLKGTTFHRFTGLPLPLFESGKIDVMMRELKSYARSRILGCQLLILDEVSIISRKTFETASNLFQRVRSAPPSLFSLRSYTGATTSGPLAASSLSAAATFAN